MTVEVDDVAIIGGGPTGLFAAFYGGLRQMKVKVIESLPYLGGQLSALYPEKYIYDVAGFPKVSGQELVDQLVEQAEQFHPTIVLGQTVNNVHNTEEGYFQLITEKEIHYSKTILITAGVGAFEPRRLKLNNIRQYEGKNLHYFVPDLKRFKDKRVCICGGGDSAVDWALMLEQVAASVALVHRRKEFRAHEKSVEKLKNSSVSIHTPFQPDEVIGDGHFIQSIIIKSPKGDTTVKLDIDELIVNYGFVSSLGPIKDWGLEIKKNSILVNSRMETSIPGIYGAGDIVEFDGKVKLIATGFGEAAMAISSAKTFIDPKARQQPQHSTTLFEKII